MEGLVRQGFYVLVARKFLKILELIITLEVGCANQMSYIEILEQIKRLDDFKQLFCTQENPTRKSLSKIVSLFSCSPFCSSFVYFFLLLFFIFFFIFLFFYVMLFCFLSFSYFYAINKTPSEETGYLSNLQFLLAA